MVAGATGIDLFLLVVAADDGVMPQTVEHARRAARARRAPAAWWRSPRSISPTRRAPAQRGARAAARLGRRSSWSPARRARAPGVAELAAALERAARAAIPAGRRISGRRCPARRPVVHDPRRRDGGHRHAVVGGGRGRRPAHAAARAAHAVRVRVRAGPRRRSQARRAPASAWRSTWSGVERRARSRAATSSPLAGLARRPTSSTPRSNCASARTASACDGPPRHAREPGSSSSRSATAAGSCASSARCSRERATASWCAASRRPARWAAAWSSSRTRAGTARVTVRGRASRGRRALEPASGQRAPAATDRAPRSRGRTRARAAAARRRARAPQRRRAGRAPPLSSAALRRRRARGAHRPRDARPRRCDRRGPRARCRHPRGSRAR